MYAVLMAGGVGTRFWPMSRKSYPKQLLSFSGKKTMLQQTYQRIKPLTSNDKVIVVTNAELKEAIEEQLPQLPKENIIGEPVGKNTAPCIGLAATIAAKRSSEKEIVVVLPADHLVPDLADFRKTIRIGINYAQKSDCLITLGIKPSYPETGYGYIQTDKKQFSEKGKSIYSVRTFAEKPNPETAERFLRSGDFLWNSGIFIWSVKAILSEIDEHIPELAADLQLLGKYVDKKLFKRILSEIYSRTKSVSIDYGIMEVAKNVCVIKSDFAWNDLGSWEAVYNISAKDDDGNVLHTKEKILIDSNNNYFYSPKKLIATIGVDELVVVDMEDALLICRKDKSQQIKTIVEQLKKSKKKSYL